MVHAAANGVIDFSSCDGTRKWWLAANFKMSVVEKDFFLKVEELHAIRAIITQAMVDTGQSPDVRQKYATEVVKEFSYDCCPWIKRVKAQNSGEQLDAIALWYSIFGNKEDEPTRE